MASENRFDPYVKLYVRKKRELFPLIEQYSGASTKGMTHGQAISTYIDLLRTNGAFLDEINKRIEKYKYVIGPIITAIVGAAGNIFGGLAQKQAEKTKQDTVLYQAVLEGQKGSDTTKILIITGFTVLLVGLGVFLVIKLKK